MADLLPISLGIARPPPRESREAKSKRSGAGSSGSASLRGKPPKDLQNKIFERDNHTCRCCGFKSRRYQEIHFLNGDLLDFSEDNLATCCIFCAQCFTMDNVGAMRSGVLLWLPEIPQHKLSHIARAIYVGRVSQGPMAEVSRKMLDEIMGRRAEAKARLKTDDPQILAFILKDYLGYGAYARRHEKLAGLRLFPLDRRIRNEDGIEFNQFPQILAYWRSKDGPFGGKAPPQWISIYQEIARKAA